MLGVMEAEHRMGHEPRDVSAKKCGYDIESRVPGTGNLRLIKVKGRHVNGRTITVTKNEILTALNKPTPSSWPSSGPKGSEPPHRSTCDTPSVESRTSASRV